MPGETVSEPKGALGSGLSDIESRIAALESSNQWWPGMLAWTAGDVAPPGFLVADGSAFDVDRYAALSAALGGASTLPNLVDRFPVGAGGAYALLSTGGAASVTLTGAQSGVPAHTHPGGTTGTESATHTHGIASLLGDFASTATVGAGTASPVVQSTGTAYAATRPSTSATASASHTHTTPTVAANSAAGAASPVSLLNPYVALTPLVHV